MINKELLNILCCPVCKGELKLILQNKVLQCSKCEEKYSIVDDIPIMLPGEYSRTEKVQTSK